MMPGMTNPHVRVSNGFARFPTKRQEITTTKHLRSDWLCLIHILCLNVRILTANFVQSKRIFSADLLMEGADALDTMDSDYI